MKTNIFFILIVLLFQTSFAQNVSLQAHYPLKTNANEQNKRFSSLNLENVTFNNEGAVCGEESKINSEDLISDINNFSVRVRFKVNDRGTFPVFSISKPCRSFGYYLKKDGKIELRVNNGDFTKISTTKYELNKLQTASLTYKNGKAILYLNNQKIIEADIQLTDCIEQYGGKDISSYDYSNGMYFKGIWSDLRIFQGVWTPNSNNNTNNNTNSNNTNNNINNNTNSNNTNNNNTNHNNSVIKTKLGDWKKLTFQVNEKPADISKTHTDIRRKFYGINNNNQLNIIWQDQEANSGKIILSIFDKNLQNPKHINLKSSKNEKLFGATADENGNYYYITHQTFEKSKNNDEVKLYKTNSKGNVLVEKKLPTSIKDLDIWKVGDHAGTLKCRNNELLLMMGRTMNKSDDGLNHQGGIATLFDANTLEIKAHFGQTSGHSFDNFLDLGNDNNFIALDLGDNYPRGVHLHKFKGSKRNSRVVYTFKTFHSITADRWGIATYPAYPEISTPQQTFYKWSNDNGTYSELGGVIEVKDGYLVIFAGEPDENGKALNNARAVSYGNKDSRNLGLIKIKKDFENVPSKGWNVVLKDIVLTKGISEKGGFYDFGGRWTEQANEGVVWLTSFKDPQNKNVKYVKTCQLPDGNILILYTVRQFDSWGSNQQFETFMLCVDENGKITTPITSLGNNFFLNRRDEILLINNQVITIEGFGETKEIKLNVLNLK
jgi:hypothetical protein